jgi:hypothetical protein
MWLSARLERHPNPAFTSMFFSVVEDSGLAGFLREIIDDAVTEFFLAHSEKGLKRHYAERDWTRLDAATAILAEILQITG